MKILTITRSSKASILLFLGSVLAICPFLIFAQKIDMEKLSGMQARAIGPAGMSGRITAIEAVESNPQIIYAGSASGGLWKSTDGAISWKPIFDQENVASIGAIAIDQNNPDVIWVGTGEGNPRNSHSGGYGLYRSINGGKTWELMGLEKTRDIHRIIIHRDDPQVVFVGAIGSPWGEHPERGVFKTTDGGKTWKKVLFVNNKTGAADLVVDPQNPNKLMAAMWEHRRHPWFFKSGGPGSGLYVTYDGGENWEKKTEKDGLPAGELGRIGLAFAPSRANRVYAHVESKKNAFYKSDDGGSSWQKVTDKGQFGNRPFYYADIFVDPQNENRIYSLWTYISVSEDAGKTWNIIANYGNRVHPDHHAFWINPKNPDYILDGNDGGLFISRDRGQSWQFAENIPVGQFYHVRVDMETPYNVYGGMQDNGSWRGPAYVWRANGIRNAYWEELYFGDGFDAAPDPSDKNYVYAMSQGGNLGRVDLRTGNAKSIQPTHPEGERLRFNWNAALAQDPYDKSTIYYGSQYVHKSSDNGNTWEIISPDLTTNDPEKQKQLESGGITYDVTGAENFTTIVSIEPSPVSQDVIWVGTDDGNLQLSQDGGKSWNNVIGNIKGVPAGTWIPQIRASSRNAGEVFVVFDNHRRDDITPYLYQSKDFGKTWKRLADENKVWGFALSFAQDPEEERLMFLGTEFGLYVSIDAGANWTKWTNGYPTVSTIDMVIHPREQDLVIGTFGRAFYVLDDIRPLRALAKGGNQVLGRPLVAYNPPDAVLAQYRQAAGTRFSAQGMFQGKNRPYGAMISYSVGKVKMKQKPKVAGKEATQPKPNEGRSGTMSIDQSEKVAASKDTLKIKVEILDSNREVIRTFKTTPKPGLNRIQWGMRRKGVRRPGQRKSRKPDAPEPGGPQVLPGTYTLRFTYGEDKDSTQIRVISDPRENISLSDRQSKNDLINRVLKDMEKMTQATDRLREAQSTAKTILSNMSGKDENSKAAKKMGKEVQKKMKELLEGVIGKRDVQGIYRDPSTVSTQLGRAYGYIQSTWERPNQSEKLRVAQAEAASKEMLTKINNFFGEDWKKFQEEVEKAKFTMFKEYKPIKLD